MKSTALLFGAYVKPILALFGAAFVGTLAYAGVRTGQNELYFLITVGGTGAHVVWQLVTLNVDDPADCFDKFVVRVERTGTGCACADGDVAGKWQPRIYRHGRHAGCDVVKT